MKAGAAAAWSVPLVQVVAAAPAVAVSGSPVLVFSSKSGSYTSTSNSISVAITLSNTGGDTSGLTVKLTFPNGFTGTAANLSAGWTVVRSGSTYTFTAAGQLAGGSAQSLSASFPLKQNQVGPGTSIALVAESYAPAAAVTSDSIVVV
jgi:hypothetical protein